MTYLLNCITREAVKRLVEYGLYLILGYFFGWWVSTLLFLFAAIGWTDKLTDYVMGFLVIAPQIQQAKNNVQPHQVATWRKTERNFKYRDFSYQSISTELKLSTEKLE